MKHGRAWSPTWKSWWYMKQRVLNPNNKRYHLYKDREIDPRWMDFENFHADMGDRPEGMTLDRRDNNKGYSKENCRWIPIEQQAKNRNHPSKCSPIKKDTAMEIKRKLLFGDRTVKSIANEYHVSIDVVSSIRSGRRWKEVAHV